MKKKFKFILKFLNNKINIQLEKSMRIIGVTSFYFNYMSDVFVRLTTQLVAIVKQTLNFLRDLIVCFIFNLNKIRFELIKINILFKKYLFSYTTLKHLSYFFFIGLLFIFGKFCSVNLINIKYKKTFNKIK